MKINYFLLYNLLLILFISIAKILTQVSYEYNSNTFTHNIYINCEKKIKKIPFKIKDGNVTITKTLLCQSNEQKGYSFIYPLFTKKLKLFYRRGTRFYVKSVYLNPSPVNYDIINKTASKSYYKINFLFNYLLGLFYIVLVYVSMKLAFLLSPKIGIGTLIILLSVAGFFFVKCDIYYIEKVDSKYTNLAIGYKVFGNKISEYNFTNNSLYLYPFSGKLYLNLDTQLMQVNSLKNIFAIHTDKKKGILLLWKNIEL